MTSGADVERNLADAWRLLRDAAGQGATVVALPENFAFMGLREADKLAVSEPHGDGPIQRFVAQAARELKLWIVAGTLPIRASTGARVSAACIVYDAQGAEVARYDKIHLFDVGIPGRDERYLESSSVEPGGTNGRASIRRPASSGSRSATTCGFRALPRVAAAGAEWFCVPSAFTAPTGRAHWEVLLRARAVENLAHLVAPAQSGFHENGRETYGDTIDSRLLGPHIEAAAAWQRLHLGRARPRAPARRQAQFSGARPSPLRHVPLPSLSDRMSVAIPPAIFSPNPPARSRVRRHEPLDLARRAILSPAELDDNRVAGILGEVMGHAVDYADIYFQSIREESWSLEDGIVKDGAHSIDRGVGCARSRGEKAGSPIRTKSCCQRCSRLRTRRVRSRAAGTRGPCRRGTRAAAAGSTCRSTPSTRSTIATRSGCSRASTARRARSTRASRRSWRASPLRTTRCSWPRATARSPPTCVRSCGSTCR
jgi:nitrilase